MAKYDAILVDAKNALYRAIFAGHSDKNFMLGGQDFAVIVLRFLRKYLEKFGPCPVHVFWDVPKSKVWRKEILPEYKEGRHKDHGFDVEAEVRKCSRLCMELFSYMGFYQYQRNPVEADDLIYAWCRSQRRNGKFIIISNDKDLSQIPYIFDNVKQYDPLKRKVLEVPKLDPVDIKCLMGDKSDAVPGYYNIGPKRAEKISTDLQLRKEFFEKKGDDIFLRNRLLIDLSLCPDTSKNIEYILQVLADKVEFNDSKVKKLVYKVRGLLVEYNNTISPFKFVHKSVETCQK